jgi:KipI family sensor histidine kinase inhibitor
VSERGLRVATGAATLARFAALTERGFPEIEDIVPADDSLLLILRRGHAPSEALRTEIHRPLSEIPCEPLGARHEIRVEYGGAAGPDLAALAAAAELDVHAYIAAHAAAEYIVAFLGFQPGFPYLRGLPQALHAPRRASPRVHVEPGSVAIGGGYCGIYPSRGPGGWKIIGRTRAALFDPERSPPALFAPGDRVSFVPA